MLLHRSRPSSLRYTVHVATAVLIGALTVPSRAARAPQQAPELAPVGFQRDRSYFSDFPWEQVDTTNGSLLLRFTDLVLPGPAGMDLRLGWVRSETNTVHGGWEFGLEGMPFRVDPLTPQTPPACCDYPAIRTLGTTHIMAPENGQVTDDVWVTSNFWRYTISTRTVDMPNGWKATFDTNGFLVEVEDLFGNTITPTWDSGFAAGRMLSVVQRFANNQQRTVDFDYGGDPIRRLPSTMTFDSRTWSYDYVDAATLESITPPAGGPWGFAYIGSLSTGVGSLTVTTPHGGTVKYDFFDPDTVNNTPETRVSQRVTGGRAIAPGTWTFSYPAFGGTTINMPGGRELEFIHSGSGWDPQTARMRPFWKLESKTLRESGNMVAELQRDYANLDLTVDETVPVVSEERFWQDGNLHTKSFTYRPELFGDYHRPQTIAETGPAGTRTITREYDYDFAGAHVIDKVKKQSVGGFHIEFSSQDGTGFLESETVFGVTTGYADDGSGNGNPTSQTDANGNTTAYTYDWGVLKDTITPEYTISRTINIDGTVASETRNAATTAFGYDSIGRVTSVAPPVVAPTNTSYASDGSSVTVTRGSTWTTTFLDGFGRPTGTQNAAGVKTTIVYDAAGRKVYQSYPFLGTADIGDTFEHDALGRVTKVIHPDNSDIVYDYTGFGVIITDENDHVTEQHWAAFGDPTDARLVQLVDAKGKVWNYTYNDVGSLTGVSQPDSAPARVWQFNSKNQLQWEIQPESGRTDYTYFAAGNVETKTDALGRVTNYQYDDNNRLTKIVAPEPADTVEFAYDGADNRTVVMNALVESGFDFDAANRLTKRTDIIAGRTFITRFEYDGRDNLIQVEYPSGREVSFEIATNADLVTEVEELGASPIKYAEHIDYHPSGAVKFFDFGNGLSENIDFDDRYRPTALSSGPLGLTYHYYANGNVDYVDDARGSSYSSVFSYDELDRLTGVSGFGGSSFTYDALGNRLTKNSQVTYHYDPATLRLTSTTGSLGVPEIGAFDYDAVGNMTADPSGTYSYNSRSQMVSATVGGATTTYGYDGDGQRKVKTAVTGTKYYVHRPGGQLLAEYDLVGGIPQLSREYIYVGSKLLASYAASSVPPSMTVTVTAPLGGSNHLEGNAVQVSADATVTSGTIQRLDFYADGVLIGSDVAAPYSVTWFAAGTGAGNASLTARLVKTTGESLLSAPVVVTVSPAELITNGNFEAGLNGSGTAPASWLTYGQPNPGGLVWSLVPGTYGTEVNFYRPPGSTQGVVFQETGRALPAFAPLEAWFRLGNSDSVRKRVTILIHDSNFSDSITCNFWLEPFQLPDAYGMRGHTSQAWANATISFYASTVNSSGNTGAYRLDEVTMQHKPLLSEARTDCVDPHRPVAGGVTSSNLIVNGTFSGGTIAPWGLWGYITSQLVNGVFEFFRTAGSPSGVVLQATNQALPDDQRFYVDFQLGNTSSVRQRVTVIVHDNNFSDQTTCSFWLPSGQPRGPYRIIGYATKAWTNATFSVYPATVGTAPSHQWLQLDDVSFEKFTGAVLGTECIEPEFFASVDLTVGLTGTGSGSVTSSPAGVACIGTNQTCSGSFAPGQSVTLTATPNAGMIFGGWAGVPTCAVEPGPACTFTVDDGQLVTARFDAPPSYTLSYYHTDVLGSVRAVTDTAGATMARHDYLAFGESGSALSGDPRRFTGKERDAETAFDYFGARYYRNITGRFASVDPVLKIDAALTHPQRWNRYSYSLNGPLRYIDPDGKWPVLVMLAARLAPYVDKAAKAARQAYIWATRFFNSPTGHEVTQAAAEAVTGSAATGPTVTGNVARLARSELDTGMRLAQKLGQNVRVSDHIGAEFITEAGKTFDALGSREAFAFWNETQFLTSIDRHLLKAVDYTVIDLTGATRAQIAVIQRHISSLPKKLQDRVVFVGH